MLIPMFSWSATCEKGSTRVRRWKSAGTNLTVSLRKCFTSNNQHRLWTCKRIQSVLKSLSSCVHSCKFRVLKSHLFPLLDNGVMVLPRRRNIISLFFKIKMNGKVWKPMCEINRSDLLKRTYCTLYKARTRTAAFHHWLKIRARSQRIFKRR